MNRPGDDAKRSDAVGVLPGSAGTPPDCGRPRR